jgi:hypothetical protein
MKSGSVFCALLVAIGTNLCRAENPSDLAVRGVGTIHGHKFAIIEATSPGRRPSGYCLREGEREDDVEVREVDDVAGKATIITRAKPLELSLEQQTERETLVSCSARSQNLPLNEAVTFRAQGLASSYLLLFYSELAKRTLLQPGNLPDFRFSLCTSEPVAPIDLMKAFEAKLAEHGLLVRPDGDKFALIGTSNQLAAVAPLLARKAKEVEEPFPHSAASSRQASLTNALPEVIPAGVIDFKKTDLNQVLDIYAQFACCNLLCPSPIPAPQITLKSRTQLTRTEVTYALQAALALNGISIERAGGNLLFVVPTSAASRAAELATRPTPPFASTNTNTVPARTLEFWRADLGQVAECYERLCGLPVELGSNLPDPFLTVRTPFPLTVSEAVRALDLLLAYNGLDVVEQDGGKKLKLVRSSRSKAR